MSELVSPPLYRSSLPTHATIFPYTNKNINCNKFDAISGPFRSDVPRPRLGYHFLMHAVAHISLSLSDLSTISLHHPRFWLP